MRKIKEILRLRFEAQMPYRGIASALNIGYGTVVDYLRRAEKAGLSWPLPDGLAERNLGRLLFPTQDRSGQRRFTEPDFPAVWLEMKNKGVTLLLLWQEYRERHGSDGYSYAQFCHRYRVWRGRQKRSMRQTHRAGEKLFVDYCGPTMAVVNPDTGEVRDAQIFVAVLGASNYTFACASWSQQLPDWLDAHVKAFDFLGGVPELIVPDNLRSAVRKTEYRENKRPAEVAAPSSGSLRTLSQSHSRRRAAGICGPFAGFSPRLGIRQAGLANSERRQSCRTQHRPLVFGHP